MKLNDTYISEKDDLEDKLKLANTEVANFNSQKEAFEKEQQSIKLWSERLSKENKEIYNAEKGLTADNNKLKATIIENEKQIDELKKNKNELEEKIASLELNNMSDKYKVFEETNRLLNEKINEKNIEINNLKTKLANKEKQLQEYVEKAKKYFCPLLNSHIDKYYNYKNDYKSLKKWFTDNNIILNEIDKYTTDTILLISNKYRDLIQKSMLILSEYYIIIKLYDIINYFNIDCDQMMSSDINNNYDEVNKFIDEYR